MPALKESSDCGTTAATAEPPNVSRQIANMTKMNIANG